MFLVDEQNHIIHDMSFVKYECQVKSIPEDKKKKIHTLDQVKRMIDSKIMMKEGMIKHIQFKIETMKMTKAMLEKK